MRLVCLLSEWWSISNPAYVWREGFGNGVQTKSLSQVNGSHLLSVLPLKTWVVSFPCFSLLTALFFCPGILCMYPRTQRISSCLGKFQTFEGQKIFFYSISSTNWYIVLGEYLSMCHWLGGKRWMRCLRSLLSMIYPSLESLIKILNEEVETMLIPFADDIKLSGVL